MPPPPSVAAQTGPGLLARGLERLNGARLWRRAVRVDGRWLRASSLDRLIYLWRHKLRLASTEFGFLRSRLRPGMGVADVGANVGLYSCLFAEAVGPEGRVDAFEPEPRLHAALAETATANGFAQIRPVRMALGAAPGTAALHRSLFNSGDNSLGPRAGLADTTLLPVSVTTLDAYLDGRAIDFVKVDVQGHELEVLRGMSTCLAINPSIELYLEIWPFGLARRGIEAADIFRFLAERGFAWTFPFGPKTADATNFRRHAAHDRWYCDIHAWRPGAKRN